MNKLLEQIFEKSVEILRQDKRCLGGWHFGSISRKQQDEFSDEVVLKRYNRNMSH